MCTTPAPHPRPTDKSLPEFPTGWYCVGFSDELQSSTLLTRRLMNQELVLYRNEKQEIVVAQAHCPHLGAHFGHGGKIIDGELECPFHAFRFNDQGQCTQTGYDTKPPRAAQLKIWPSREQSGLILVWYHPEQQAPQWEVPTLDTANWSPWSHTSWVVKTHPQEIVENSVDFGHFKVIHGYDETEVISPATLDGPHLHARYAMTRAADVFLGLQKTIRTQFDVAVHGLGVSVVHAHVRDYDLELRILVLPTPIGNNRVELRAALAIDERVVPEQVNPLLALLPARLSKRLVRSMAFKGYAHDIAQDFPMWENKIYIEKPTLAQGDGPIGLYRKWTQQFYAPARGSSLVQLPSRGVLVPAA